MVSEEARVVPEVREALRPQPTDGLRQPSSAPVEPVIVVESRGGQDGGSGGRSYAHVVQDSRGNMYISVDTREKCLDLICTTDQDKLTKGFLIYTTDQDRRYMIDYFHETAAEGEQRIDLGLPTAIDLETSNGRAVKERSRKKKIGGGPTFTSLLTARSKEVAAIGGVARKREDLIIVNIDEASGDDELAVAEYAEDIYKFYKLIEGEIQVCDYMGKQPDIDERMRSILKGLFKT
ncbi:hypothetical protein Dimus_020747 [Dionaea muscipula]